MARFSACLTHARVVIFQVGYLVLRSCGKSSVDSGFVVALRVVTLVSSFSLLLILFGFLNVGEFYSRHFTCFTKLFSWFRYFLATVLGLCIGVQMVDSYMIY